MDVIIRFDFRNIFTFWTREFVVVVDMLVEAIPASAGIRTKMTMEQCRAVSLKEYFIFIIIGLGTKTREIIP